MSDFNAADQVVFAGGKAGSTSSLQAHAVIQHAQQPGQHLDSAKLHNTAEHHLKQPGSPPGVASRDDSAMQVGVCRPCTLAPVA